MEWFSRTYDNHMHRNVELDSFMQQFNFQYRLRKDKSIEMYINEKHSLWIKSFQNLNVSLVLHYLSVEIIRFQSDCPTEGFCWKCFVNLGCFARQAWLCRLLGRPFQYETIFCLLLVYTKSLTQVWSGPPFRQLVRITLGFNHYMPNRGRGKVFFS